MEQPDNFKVVFIGDTKVGKTCLLETFSKREFPSLDDGYIITHKVNQPLDIYWDDKLCTIHYWDTYGAVCEKMRRLTLGDAKCIVMCYAIDNPISFQNIRSVWLPEIRKTGNCAPLILVGTKSDLRPDVKPNPKRFVTRQQGEKMRNKVGAVAFVECSAMQIESLDLVFAIVADMTELGAIWMDPKLNARGNRKTCTLS